MRAFALFAALALVAAPLIASPSPAYADGIERPRQRPRVRPQPAPEVQLLGPREEVRREESNIVTLPASFFAASGGGVGADVGGWTYSSTTVIVGGASARASAYAHASARAGARAGGHGRGGGCGCR